MRWALALERIGKEKRLIVVGIGIGLRVALIWIFWGFAGFGGFGGLSGG